VNATLDPQACYRALAAKDARFDGLFFVGVTTTGIYCRPVCRARTPSAGRCTFFTSAVAAEREGFRACFRCRPELAPGGAPMDAASRVVATAVARIEEGALNEGDIEDLARELGITSRHLRRAMHDELGVSPVELAQSQRLALAKRLLHDTQLSMTEVAMASGFSSLRRFNAAFLARFGKPPSALRRLASAPTSDTLPITLAYREPFDWKGLLGFLGPRATLGVEVVAADAYTRTARIGSHVGWVRVSPIPGRAALRADVSVSLAPVLMPLVARLRQLFDLDARPDTVAAHLRRDVLLRRLVTKRPGLRVPGAFDGFEIAVRAILGQQVSVAAATTFAGRLATAFGEPVTTNEPVLRALFPTAARLARASVTELASIGLTKSRAHSLGALARAVDSGEVRLDARGDPAVASEALLKVPGIGPWTASYVAMRALGAPDSFPEGDLALRRALGDLSARDALTRAESWRPWRAYAALHLWTSLSGDEA
jgi:AraC family transcriptional regulator of adaptative response / DNA-3-methyladenine glycosylase II